MKRKLRILSIIGLFLSISLRGVSQQQSINSAILQILQNEGVENFIHDSILLGNRETIAIADMQLLGIDEENLETLTNNDIDFLYFPYIDLNINNKDSIIIINLDGVESSSGLVDKITNSSVSESAIMARFTAMYKTTEHAYDDNSIVSITRFNYETVRYDTVQIRLEGKWLPWRRCHCTRETVYLDDNGNPVVSSIGTCNRYHQNTDRCNPVCDRTGFIDQTCDGDSCSGC
jgi:hypothetical protein